MKLTEVQFREKVPTGPPGDTTSRLHAIAGTGPAQGWSLDYEAGMVTAAKGDMVLLVPVGNVAFMKPAPKVEKAAKPAGGA